MALVRSAAHCRYDVFLSFRGEDTRKTFTDHLYTAFVDQGFRTFRDDDELERGEDINPGIERAIRESRCSVIVFSKDYASSRWCLDEVLMILQRKKSLTSDHVILPVFYDVDPSQVRKQTGSFGEAFARHQKTQPSNKVKQWRAALGKVADLGGMVLRNQDDGYESKFIKKIVKVIADKISRPLLSVAQNLIGIHSQVQNINSWLRDGSSDVDVLAIYGMSGIGKTTIAKSVYNSNYRRFAGSCFLENIREISEQPNGLIQIQIQLLSNILNGKQVKIHSVSEGIIKIRDAISSKRILLVLDDVDDLDVLNAVLGMQDQFYPGSKIIMTTRRERLLRADQITKVHIVETLGYSDSLELFSWHAFGQDHPIEGYMEHSKKVVDHSGGLPLALRVLGSSLSGESIAVWKSALEKLEAIPNSEIMKKLRISYDCLQDDHDKQLFLHIVCFFIGKDKDFIVRVLDGCDYYTVVGIQNLIDRCLVTIDRYNKVVQMHDMIRDMGRGIVRLESEEPERRSRLWHHKDSLRVLREKNGTDTIQGLVLNMHMHHGDSTSRIVLETNAFARMRKLRFLHLSHVQLNHCYKEFPTGLKWLCWHEFSLDFIPDDFSLEGLVILEMRHSSLRQVWNGTKCLPLLKILDLSHSHSLIETSDLSFCPNLEKLILIDCVSLIDVHISIGNLERLVYLNMKDCKSIRMLPTKICRLKSLEALIISGCSNLEEFPIEMMRYMEYLKVFEADGVRINELLTTNGEVKSWPGRSSSSFFWTCFPCSIVELRLGGCNLSDVDFPWEFHNQHSLKILDLRSNPIVSLPNCIKGLKRINQLCFYNCKELKSLEGLPKVNFSLHVGHCSALEKITYQSFSSCIPYAFFPQGLHPNLVEVEYIFKLEPIGKVDVEMINLLGLCNMESMPTIQIGSLYFFPQERPIQGLYEYGIFSTFLPGNEVPGQFSYRNEGSSISVTVPSLPNLRIRGWNIFVVYASCFHIDYDDIDLDSLLVYEFPLIIKVTHKSKSLKWIYGPSCYGIPPVGEDMIWLSHWNMENELQGGDEVALSVFVQSVFVLKEWGIQIVHEQEENNNMSTQHNTPGSYSYPRVIGGDLSPEELLPRKYFLLGMRLSMEDMPYRWFYTFTKDSDEDTDSEEEEEEAKSACRDSYGHGRWEISNESSSKDSYDDDDVDFDINLERGADDVELDGRPSISTATKKSSGKRNRSSFTDVCAESSKKRNELLEKGVTDSAPLRGNDEAIQPVPKDVVADEELKQCFEILNTMEEIDDDSYSKSLMLFREDATLRKMFVRMPDKRRTSFILHL